MTPAATVDVRGYACPLTWVKTRIALERLATGEVLEVLLREGEPLENVPRTAAEEGHRVLAVAALPGGTPDAYRLLLEKGAPAPATGGLP